MGGTYYNEIDPFAAEWLRELILHGCLPEGDVDERDIWDVLPNELSTYTQCHFFAGIGGWPYALQLAGWPTDRPVWTGSCPCQPFSQAGQGRGTADDRHHWPAFKWLIEQRRPPVVFGEQVTSKAGRAWLAGVRTDLEDTGYAVGAADLCAAGAAAPHLRARHFWVADTRSAGRQQDSNSALGDEAPDGGARRYGSQPDGDHVVAGDVQGDHARLAHANSRDSFWGSGPLQVGWNAIEATIERGGRAVRAQWRVEPGVPLLAYGIPNRVALLGGFGNAIVPQVAAEVIRAYMEVRGGWPSAGARPW